MAKAKNDSKNLDVDEIIATLNHSTLPTILVEGVDDIMVCRWLEQFIPWQEGDFYQCGGRNTLLEVYRRRSELKVNTVFLADQDMYVFCTIPEEYQSKSIVWTHGYSIENDIYAGTSKIDDLLEPNEQNDYQAILQKVIAWFAFEVEEHQKGREHRVNHFTRRDRDKNLNQQLAQNTLDREGETYLIKNRHDTGFSLELWPRQLYQPPSPQLVQEITAGFKLRVRGKVLFDILACYLDDNKRIPRHSKEALYAIGAKPIAQNQYMNRLVAELKRALKCDEVG
jgi:hypothetical protein